MPQASRTFRVFVSSTFSDLKAERNALQEHVFPKLRKLCMQNGCRFQAIDLRWGVSEEAGRDQRTMRICLDEITRCRKVTPRPNFVVLLGDRYGWLPLPEEIPANEYKEIEQQLKNNPEFHLFEGWYKCDNNAIPPTYILQTRTGEFENYEFWKDNVEKPLRSLLLHAIEGMNLAPKARLKYIASATEQEIVYGALEQPDAAEHVYCFFRTIKNLPHDKSAKDFLDLDENWKLDREARIRLKVLKERKLERKLEGNIHNYKATWTGKGITKKHLKELCDDVYKRLSEVILSEIKKLKVVDELGAEIEQHEKFGDKRRRFFVGRKDILREIDEYIKSGDTHPLAVHGESGTGKSALIAEAAERAKSSNTDVVVRFIGATPDSSNGRSLLESLCKQISTVYRADTSDIPSEYRDLVSEFPKRMTLATADKPLIIFLDALDQLSSVDNARLLTWLPKELPENVRLIVSTLPGECYKRLQVKLPEPNIIELKPMPQNEGKKLLKLWLDNAKRTLQPEQRKEVLTEFNHCGLPLYLKLAFEEARLWRSYDDVPDLGSDIPGIISNLFKRLSDPANHGPLLVSYALGYLRCVKNGLTEDEMLDLLAADDEYFQYFLDHAQHDLPEMPEGERRLPVVIWSRLYHDLEPYLTVRAADVASLLGFFHRQFAEVVDEEYLIGDKKTKLHKRIANHFVDQPHEFVAKDGGKTPNFRKMSELPYQQSYGKDWQNLETTLTDLTFIEAKCTAKMTYDLVTDYDRLGVGRAMPGPIIKTAWKHEGRLGIWCPHCLAWFPINESQLDTVIPCPECKSKLKINPFTINAEWHTQEAQREVRKRERIEDVKVSKDVGEFADFARGQLHILKEHPQLAFQQAANWPDKLAPSRVAKERVESGLEKRPWFRLITPYHESGSLIQTLGAGTNELWCCSISPDDEFLAFGSGGLFAGNVLNLWSIENWMEQIIFRGHQSVIAACRFNPDGKSIVSVDWDGTLRVWDIYTGTEILTLKGHSPAVWDCEVSHDCRLIVSAGQDATVRIWDIETGQDSARLEGHQGPVMACSITLDEQKILSVSRDGTLRVWDAIRHTLINCIYCNQGAVTCCSISPDGKTAVTGGVDRSLKIWDIRDVKLMGTLIGHSRPVNACDISRDGAWLVSASDDKTVRLWDLAAMKARGVFKGHGAEVTDCRFGNSGEFFVSSSRDGTIKVWDAVRAQQRASAEEISKLLTSIAHDGPATVVKFSPNGTWGISASDDGSLRHWSTAKGKSRFVMHGHTKAVHGCAISQDGSFIASASADNTVRLWDVRSGRLNLTLEGHTEPVMTCAISPDSSIVLSGGWDCAPRFWDASTGKLITTLCAPKRRCIAVMHCAFSREGDIVLIDTDQQIEIWDISKRIKKAFCRFTCESKGSYAPNISPDGELLISGDVVWDIKSGRKLAVLTGHSGGVTYCDFSFDSRLAITASKYDLTIRTWDLRNYTPLAIFKGHRSHPWVMCAAGDVLISRLGLTFATSRDGLFLVSACTDRTLRVWELDSGLEIGVISFPGSLLCLALHPSSPIAICGDSTGAVYLAEIKGLNHFPDIEKSGDIGG